MAPATNSITARHLCRGLLRSASYLPDDFARTYFHNYILYRFRNASEATPVRLLNARKAIKTLDRAAAGELKPLSGILNQAYGRSGRRRRLLLGALLQRPIPNEAPSTDASSSQHSLEPTIPESNRSPFSRYPILDRLAQSQSRNHPPESSRLPIRIFEPQIPATNIWNRPMPLCRQKNMRARFWATTLDKILPPLPETEWNRLRDLATGVLRFEGSPVRRAAARPIQLEESKGARGLLQGLYVTAPIRRAAKLETEARVRERNRHVLTPRFMKRMWAGVWGLTPMMSYNTATQEWTVTWGGNKSAASRGEVGKVGRADLELFEGTGEGRERSVAPNDGKVRVPRVKSTG